MNGDRGKKYLLDYVGKTDAIFKNYLDNKVGEARALGVLPSELIASLAEIARKGKKIRGALTVLGYKAAGGKDDEEILKTSLFMELVHTGLLVHDDIQDRDDTRRGLPTIHKQFEKKGEELHLNSPEHYGISLGLNTGISAYYLSMQMLMEGKFPTKNLVRAGQIYADYILRVTYGQALDVANIFVNNVNQEELLNILKYKSAEYTGVLPLLAGATLAGETREEYLSDLKEFGLCLGWAFQIQDDLLGAFGDEDKLGKPVGSDIREGKVTLLMLYLSEHGTDEQKEFQKKVLGNGGVSEEDIQKMRSILKESGAYDYVVKMGWNYVKKGESIIPKLTSDAELADIFRSLLYFMMERAL